MAVRQVPERPHHRQMWQRMQRRARPVRLKALEGVVNVGHRRDPVAAGEELCVARDAEGPAQPTSRPQAPAGVQGLIEGPAWTLGLRHHPVGPAQTQGVAARPGARQFQEVVLAAAAPGAARAAVLLLWAVRTESPNCGHQVP